MDVLAAAYFSDHRAACIGGAIVTADHALLSQGEDVPVQLELLGDIYDAAPYGYVIKKDQAEFAQAVADAVKALITDGTYKTILDKWGVQAGAIDSPAVNP